MRTWEPDVEMDCAIAHRIVSSQFPEYKDRPPAFLGRGWDNFCIEYSNDVVFRLPTRKLGADILRNEIAALPVVSGAIDSLSVPVILYRGQPADPYPYPFVGYFKLPGETADRFDWSPAARLSAATVLGRFLRKLHSIDPYQHALAGLPTDEPSKCDPKWILTKLQSRLPLIEAHVRMSDPPLRGALAVAEYAAEQRAESREHCLVHGDLYARHLIAQEGTVTGIIDWGDVQQNDPAVDLSIVYTFFDPDERPSFWAAYGRPESDFNRPIMLVRAAMYGFALLAYGLEESDEASVRMGEQILGRINHA